MQIKGKHVVHCVNHRSSIYEERNGHFSILTPLCTICTPEATSQYIQMVYKFMCKNSCPSGINQRCTELIFTIENKKNIILARQKLFVRICSCPKRHKVKEETELSAISSTSLDNHVCNINLAIVGKANYLALLKYAHNLMTKK